MASVSDPPVGSSQLDDGGGIKALDASSVHKISSGQVVVDLQTAVKELVENSLDAAATNIEVRFKDHGLESFEVIDNGSGIPPEDYESIALKHHTSKLSSFSDLESVATFGFRGEALSSLCALAQSVSVTTATAAEAPVGTIIEFERTGKAKSKKGKAARQRGTTVTVSGLFKPLPVRRKELERNVKREFGKALTLLHAYALVPCANENRGVRLTVTNQPSGGYGRKQKTVQLRTDGTPSTRASVSAIWGPKALDNLVDLDLRFVVEVEAAVLRRLGRTRDEESSNEVGVHGLISKFAVGCGRNGTDRQYFFVNGRPCAPSKVQKAINEVYRSFNATQSPFVIADFVLPTNSCDVNVSPDKRTILLHSENNLIQALRTALEEKYAPSRSTFDVHGPKSQAPRQADPTPPDARLQISTPTTSQDVPLFLPDDAEDEAPSAVSQESEQTRADPADESTVDHAEEQGGDLTFGTSALLSDPGALSLRGSKRRLDGDAEDSDTEEVAEDSDVVQSRTRRNSLAEDSTLHQASTRTRGRWAGTIQSTTSHTRPGGESDVEDQPSPRSPTVTQIVKQRSEPRSPPRVPADASAEIVHTADARPSSSRLRSVTPEDPPIPSLRPPTRPLARAVPPAGVGSRSNGEQMVLSTAGASWSLRRRAEELESDRPKKRSKVEATRTGKEAQKGMRDILKSFARPGSQVAAVEVEAVMEVDDDAGEQGAGSAEDEGMGVAMEEDAGDEARHPAPSEGDEELSNADMKIEDPVPPDAEPGEGADAPPHEPMDEDAAPSKEVVDLTQDDGGAAPSSRTDTRSDLVHSSVSFTSDEVVRTDDTTSITMSFDISQVSASWRTLRGRRADARQQREELDRSSVKLNDVAGVSNTEHDDEAVEALSRVINKADFAEMEVVGQFNLGFIVVRRRKPPTDDGDATVGAMDDLFIVDQHAADEKYNFETLQRTTKIDSQKLFRPQTLELTAADELVALENIDVLRQNGFELDVSEERPPGQRVQLTAQPVSKSTVFDIKDLEELLHLIQDRPAGQMVRCSKARAMFAMRACRKSIMIGTPLNKRQMTAVVQHMGTMDQPWHCPHGRPTMRHLSDIAGMGWDRDSRPGRKIDWTAFARATAASKE
ncbi:hypothetical protein C8Q76DRAFT_681916 [Earliella scabrosa]|nr:hypothetical protein C8Q76DRAFT_681916 [Earliella scabrosa]